MEWRSLIFLEFFSVFLDELVNFLPTVSEVYVGLIEALLETFDLIFYRFHGIHHILVLSIDFINLLLE